MTIAEAEVMVDWALSKTGCTYRAQDPDRWIYDCVFDCSSLGVRADRAAGVIVPQWVTNTVEIYKWAQQLGALVSVDKAIATRGAGLLKGRSWGFGSKGHYAISLGDGTEMAAHGTRSGVHPGPVDRSFYNDGIILPPSMMHYADLDPVVDPEILKALAALEAWKDRVTKFPLHYGATTNDVSILNDILIRRVWMDPKYKSNTYTGNTRAAVKHLKRAKKLKSKDGSVFGSEAAAALLMPPS